MRFVIVSMALAASLLAFVAAMSIGLFLAGVGESGARGAGVALAAGAVPAFASALLLCFAPPRYFRGKGKALAAVAAILALVPVVAISGAALFFAGNPLGSSSPALDWAAFATGLLLALGGVSIVVLAASRSSSRVLVRPPGPGAEPTGPSPGMMDDGDDVRVTRLG